MEKETLLINDGLSLDELKTLRKRHPTFSKACEQLSQFEIPQTIEHNDFHDNNILINGKHIVINDWGDTVISHPFFSLAGCLNSAKRNHQLTETDERYLALKHAYLENWVKYAPLDKLQDAFVIAEKLRLFQFTLSFSGITQCEGIETFTQYHGYMAEALRELIGCLWIQGG